MALYSYDMPSFVYGLYQNYYGYRLTMHSYPNSALAIGGQIVLAAANPNFTWGLLKAHFASTQPGRYTFTLYALSFSVRVLANTLTQVDFSPNLFMEAPDTALTFINDSGVTCNISLIFSLVHIPAETTDPA